MKKTILLAFSFMSVFWGAAAGFAASSFEVKVSSDGNVAVTTSQAASAQLVPQDGSAPTEIAANSTFSSETGAVRPVDPNDSFAGGFNSDARSEDGKAIAANSALPGPSGAGDVATAAGEEGPGSTETAAGGGTAADTQAPISPVAANPFGPLTTPF